MTLAKMISPRSIALIGASSNPEKIGFQILSNILNGGFAGRVFPVNLSGETILNLQSVKSVLDIKEHIDLAIIAIPAKFVRDSVLECVKTRVSSVIVISAGFAEIGEAGKLIQDEIRDICEKNNISLLGPNCLGLINTEINLNATFAKELPKTGHVSLLSQSGAIITSIIDWSKNSPIGFSKIFSIGNKALIKESDLFEYLYNDNETKVVAAYIENLEVDRHLSEIFIKNAKKKPTIILFGGKSSFGARAALSHTGSIVSSYTSVKAYLTQAGVIIADTLEDLLLYSRVFSSYQQINGNNITIITNAGGPAIAASDHLHDLGLNLNTLSPKTVSLLQKQLRPEANLTNPVDLLGDASEIDYQKALEIVTNDSGTDGILVILTPQSATKIIETAEVIASVKSRTPIISSFVGGEILTSAKDIIENSGKPCFSYPEEAALGLLTLFKFSAEKQTLLVPHSPKHNLFNSENKEKHLLDYKLPIVQYKECKNIDEVKDAADSIGFPVVLKMADQNAHKSDEGKVVLNIEDSFHLQKAFLKTGSPAIVGPMVNKKFEIMLGIKKEAGTGTTIVFGTGGIYAEIYQDFSYRIAPLDQKNALSMILETKIGRILNGARNQKKYDLAALADILVRATNFADNFSNIKEIDFNPIVADADNFHLVDVRIILTENIEGDK
ncbi:MAG: acetate--CoA ligase family protein [Patescibacteria group bacterium]|jgi:acetyltransferase